MANEMTDETPVYNPTYPVLPDAETCTAQEVFDAVALHLLRQGKPCTDGDSCYNRLGCLACAIGCLMTDAEVAENNDIMPRRLLDSPHVELLRALRVAHDCYSDDPASLHRALRDTAQVHGLSCGVLEDFYP
jgi:hypothetical protein